VNELDLYRIATTAGGPLIRLYLERRKLRAKEDPERFGERLGCAGLPRPEGNLIWVHAASVGESLSLLALIEVLCRRWPGHAVLMTTGTVTSARLMADRLPAGAIHQFIPVDRATYVRRFLDHWRPDLVVWSESEFWPNLLLDTGARGVPMVLVQGRISDRSYANWCRRPRTIARLLSCFALCLGQSSTDAERLRYLGAPRVGNLGNLKFAKPPLPFDAEELDRLRCAIDGRPVWLAASTHPGEEEIATGVHLRLRGRTEGLLTAIVPRHPGRGQEIARRLSDRGVLIARRSAGEPITKATDVYIGDTIGELGLFYRLAPVVFVGKSLAGEGGQNPLEAAQLGCALVHGPQMNNFAEIVHRLAAVGAAQEVCDEGSLAEAVAQLLADDTARRRMGEAGRQVAAAEAGALDRVVDAIAAFLPPVQEKGGEETRRART
jgi:3-deoxy-D-manno-octulosonic-acid transferase